MKVHRNDYFCKTFVLNTDMETMGVLSILCAWSVHLSLLKDKEEKRVKSSEGEEKGQSFPKGEEKG